MIFVFKLRGAEHDSDVVGSCRETTEIQEISLSAWPWKQGPNFGHVFEDQHEQTCIQTCCLEDVVPLKRH